MAHAFKLKPTHQARLDELSGVLAGLALELHRLIVEKEPGLPLLKNYAGLVSRLKDAGTEYNKLAAAVDAASRRQDDEESTDDEPAVPFQQMA